MRPEKETSLRAIRDISESCYRFPFELMVRVNPAQYEWVRRLVGRWQCQHIEMEKMPSAIFKGCVLASNYPGVFQALRGVMKIASALPGKGAPLMAIAREEIISESSPLWGGFLFKSVIAATKDAEGRYTLKTENNQNGYKKALRQLQKNQALWLSVTGSTRLNGLCAEEARNGAVRLASRSQKPLIPTGLVVDWQGRVNRVRFGSPLFFPKNIQDFNPCTLLVMAEIASLLPCSDGQSKGQRGDFEKPGEMVQALNINPQFFKKEP